MTCCVHLLHAVRMKVGVGAAAVRALVSVGWLALAATAVETGPTPVTPKLAVLGVDPAPLIGSGTPDAQGILWGFEGGMAWQVGCPDRRLHVAALALNPGSGILLPPASPRISCG